MYNKTDNVRITEHWCVFVQTNVYVEKQ